MMTQTYFLNFTDLFLKIQPFTDSTWAANGFNASDLMKKYPVSDADAKNIDIISWTKDSLKIAEDFIYKSK